MANAPPPRDDWFSSLFGFAETNYKEARRLLRVVPSATHPSSSMIESLVNGASFNAGSFSTPSLKELRAEGAKAAEKMRGVLKVHNELGDVAKKHAQAENRFATFQVASQFNCLEFIGPDVIPEQGITKYVNDRTQGPACSIACGPATAYRNYFARVRRGESFVEGQTRQCQIDNLADFGKAIGNGPEGKFFQVRNGYTLADATRLRKLDVVLTQLTEENKLDKVRDSLRLGVHQDVQVTSYDWGRRSVTDSEQLVTQVFGSACSLAYNRSTDSKSWRNLASIILEASYEATLWAAVINANKHRGEHGSRRVFLTLLGGGVFGNSTSWILQAMRRAFSHCRHCDLDIRIVTYAGQIDPQLLAIEQEFSASLPVPRPIATKRGRQEEHDVVEKRQKISDVKVSPHESARRGQDVVAERIAPKTSNTSPAAKTVVASTACLESPPKSKACFTSTKRRKGGVSKGGEKTSTIWDDAVLKEAEKLGYAGGLRNLAARPEVEASGVSQRAMLDALKRSDGLVNKAKHALLGV